MTTKTQEESDICRKIDWWIIGLMLVSLSLGMSLSRFLIKYDIAHDNFSKYEFCRELNDN